MLTCWYPYWFQIGRQRKMLKSVNPPSPPPHCCASRASFFSFCWLTLSLEINAKSCADLFSWNMNDSAAMVQSNLEMVTRKWNGLYPNHAQIFPFLFLRSTRTVFRSDHGNFPWLGFLNTSLIQRGGGTKPEYSGAGVLREDVRRKNVLKRALSV